MHVPFNKRNNGKMYKVYASARLGVCVNPFAREIKSLKGDS